MKDKRCCRCKLIKPLSEFHNRFETRDGHNYHCRVCERKSYYQRRVARINAASIVQFDVWLNKNGGSDRFNE